MTAALQRWLHHPPRQLPGCLLQQLCLVYRHRGNDTKIQAASLLGPLLMIAHWHGLFFSFQCNAVHASPKSGVPCPTSTGTQRPHAKPGAPQNFAASSTKETGFCKASPAWATYAAGLLLCPRHYLQTQPACACQHFAAALLPPRSLMLSCMLWNAWRQCTQLLAGHLHAELCWLVAADVSRTCFSCLLCFTT